MTPDRFAKGRLYTVTNATAASTFTYNKMGQVLREDKTIEGIPFSLIRTYNLAGAQTSMTLPNGTKISNAYNSAGQLTQITSDWVDANHPAILATGFEYAPSGALTYLEYGNGTASSRSFNSSGQLKTLQHGPLGDPGGFLDYRYHYNEGTANNGQIVSIDDFNDTTKSFTYTYDTLGRLKTAATTGTHWGLSWTYDRYGNRLTQSVTKGSAPGQSLSVSTTTNRVTTWVYDAAGNTLDDGQHSYSYDANNMITQLDASAAIYKSDGQGNRVVKQTPTETIYYFFGVAEYSASTWRRLFVHPGRTKLAEYRDNSTFFSYPDHLGTSRLSATIQGAVEENWSNYPYGEEWEVLNSPDDQHHFAGLFRDTESANDYALMRSLVVRAGRWNRSDPLTGHLGNPQRLNKYPYVLNDPINLIDRTGGDHEIPCLVERDCPEGPPEPDLDAVWFYFLSQGSPLPRPAVSFQRRDTGNWFRRLFHIQTFAQRVNSALNKLENNLAADEISSDCLELFNKLGITPGSYLEKLNTLEFFDGTKSEVIVNTNLMPDWWVRASDDAGKKVSDLFAENPGRNAWTPFYTPWVFLNPGSRITPGMIGHEIFHKCGFTDPDIQRAWNLTESDDTSNITKRFKDDCL